MNYESFENQFPHSGGLDDQPAEWVEAISCVRAARNKANSIIESQIEADRKAKEKNKSRNRR